MFAGMAVGFFGLLPALPVGGPIAGILLGGLLEALSGNISIVKICRPLNGSKRQER
jgi:hypothetical protein